MFVLTKVEYIGRSSEPQRTIFRRYFNCLSTAKAIAAADYRKSNRTPLDWGRFTMGSEHEVRYSAMPDATTVYSIRELIAEDGERAAEKYRDNDGGVPYVY